MNLGHPELAHWFARNRTLLVASLGALLLVGVTITFLVLSASPPSAATSPTASPSPPASPTLQPTPSPQPTPTPNPFNRALLRNRFTVLAIGEDSNPWRQQRGADTRTDALMVVSLSPRQKRISLISLPRDVVDIPMKNGLTFTGKVNGLAQMHGYKALVGAFETMLDIHIDGYVKIDMDNFVDLVDAVGGVRVTNPAWLVDDHLGLSLAPGRVRLDGATALKYTRSRYTSSDYARAARQQQVLVALARKYTNRATDVDLTDLLGTLASLETDLDLAEMPTFLRMGRRAGQAKVTAIVLSPPRFALAWGDQNDGRGWVIIPNVEEMRTYARRALRD